MDSLPRDGPGTKATGIIMDISSNITIVFGSDSKAGNGSNSERRYQSNQNFPEKKKSVDHSTNWRRLVSLSHSVPEKCQGVLLDLERID
jgi:hypothetical protein